MALKTVKCPSCSGDLNLDDEREFGFCQFCGSKVMLNETINVKHSGTVQLDFSSKAANRMKLARNAFEDGKYHEAYDHYTKVLEDAPDQCEALNRKGICSAYMVSISKINCNELTRGYKEAIVIFSDKLENNPSDKERDGINKEVNNLVNDMTEFLLTIYKTFENIKDELTFDGQRDAVECQSAMINFANILHTVNQIIPSGFEDNSKLLLISQYELCNKILSVNIRYISEYSVDKSGARIANYNNITLNVNLKMQINDMRKIAVESYNNLPTFAAALSDFSNSIKNNTDERKNIEADLNKSKVKSKDAISEFWDNNPSLMSQLKAKRNKTWIAVGIGLVILLAMVITTAVINNILPSIIGVVALGIAIIIKISITRRIQAKYEDNVFTPEIKKTLSEISNLSVQLKAKDNQIKETNQNLNKYKQNNLIS